MTKEEIQSFLFTHEAGRYEREGFDKAVSKSKLNLSCPVIHITGSNGKGSTAHFLQNIYLEAGYHVATFIKPCLSSINEMFLFDGKEIADEDIERIYSSYEKLFDKYDLSPFEREVFIGFTYFNEKRADLAIIECGMGGLLDATNLSSLPTILSIITSISLEHTSYLGTTLSQIALNKAGIIKEGVPVLLGKMEEEVRTIMFDLARRKDASVFEVDSYHFPELNEKGWVFDYRPFKRLQIEGDASYQMENASLAIEATKILETSFPVNEEALRKGLSLPLLPGRGERKGNLYFDGAHNPDAIVHLMKSLPSIAKGKDVHVLFASFRDKNIAAELPTLANHVSDITLTSFPHPRARTEEDYFLYIEDHPFIEDPMEALEKLTNEHPDDLILICGSLHFVGYMRKRCGQ